ncbi:MAG: glucose-6-phosphate isomerase [Acutalibacteraceae bacterium]
MFELETRYVDKFIDDEYLKKFNKKVKLISKELHKDCNNEVDYRGWIDLPVNISKEEIEDIQMSADRIVSDSDVFIVIGVGGSYLGAAAAIDFLHSSNYNYLCKNTPKIFFVGNNMSESYISEILEICRSKEVSVNVISKSGGTIEPAVSFRIFKNFLEKKYGKDEAKNRIYCTTDRVEGSLLKIAKKEGYKIFNIPRNIGGRYSVLTAVGLLPICVSGANISKILNGARDAYFKYMSNNLVENDCYKYALIRNILYRKNKTVELIVGYEPRLSMFFEWWKQLFGESEGKAGKGIFPTSAIYSRDLHSLGQFVQDGSKILFETILKFRKKSTKLIIPTESDDLDNLNYVCKNSVQQINDIICEATLEAHTAGGVPNVVMSVDDFSEYNLGYLIYFFEKACAVSAKLLGVDPFNQPGVEAYKSRMINILKNQ